MTRRIFSALFLAAVLTSATASNAQLISDLVTAGVSASREKVYANEIFQIMLSITSTGVSLDQNFQLQSMPDRNKCIFSEFKELPAERTLQGSQIRDKRRFICDARALNPGTLEIAPTIRLGIVSGFGPFRQISYYDIKTTALSLPVIPLPVADRPAAFSGAIGQFTLNVETAPSDVAVGDLITVTATIRGKGYLEPVPAISIPPVPSFRVYPSKAIPGTESGTKTFEQTIVPQGTNASSIPAITFCYFDPATGAYKTLSSGPFPITFHAQKKLTAETIYRPAQLKTPPLSRIDRRIGMNREETGNNILRPEIILPTVYWTAIIALSLLVTIRYRHGPVFALCILISAAMLFLQLWTVLTVSSKEGEVVRSEKARLAPAYSAVAIFDAPRGFPARVLDSHGAWSKIEMADRKGWIPTDALTNSPATQPSPAQP